MSRADPENRLAPLPLGRRPRLANKAAIGRHEHRHHRRDELDRLMGLAARLADHGLAISDQIAMNLGRKLDGQFDGV